ncbi:MAG: signal peptidase II [Erysipelotrichaceae bacterium]|nr:signal peptidase II [Erysipelotrichaceae bacterium]
MIKREFMIAFLYGVCIAIFVLIDQIVKKAVVNNIALSEVILVIKDFFYITYVRNYGAGFSILQNATLFLIALSIIACIALFYLLMTAEKNDLISKMSYLLIISGAIGNLIDRIRYGYVVDFLDFKIFTYDFPVFNVADCFITVGCFILIIKILWEARNAGNQTDRR